MLFSIKHRIVLVQHPPYQTRVCAIFSYTLNWKFVSRIRFEEVEDIKMNTVAQGHAISKEKFQCASINEKLDRISVLNANWIILKEINVLFIVHFCFGKYLQSRLCIVFMIDSI